MINESGLFQCDRNMRDTNAFFLPVSAHIFLRIDDSNIHNFIRLIDENNFPLWYIMYPA